MCAFREEGEQGKQTLELVRYNSNMATNHDFGGSCENGRSLTHGMFRRERDASKECGQEGGIGKFHIGCGALREMSIPWLLKNL